MIHRFAHPAMATVFEIHCTHDAPTYASQAAAAAFAVVDRLEEQLSRYRANSDVSRINALRTGESTCVAPSTLECLGLARQLFELTGGAFDVSLGSGLDGLDLVAGDFTVHSRKDGVRLDLGGIGKGFAVDLMAEVLGEWELPEALLHGGFSSVRALAPPSGQGGWPLTLSSPAPGEQRVLARLLARELALSASGTRKGGHIVDPASGRAACGRTVWVGVSSPAREEVGGGHGEASLEKTATLAEGLSTAFMVLPLDEIERLCGLFGEIEAWVIQVPTEGGSPDGRLSHFPARGPADDVPPVPVHRPGFPSSER